jgi:hypothetical protein
MYFNAKKEFSDEWKTVQNERKDMVDIETPLGIPNEVMPQDSSGSEIIITGSDKKFYFAKIKGQNNFNIRFKKPKEWMELPVGTSIRTRISGIYELSDKEFQQKMKNLGRPQSQNLFFWKSEIKDLNLPLSFLESPKGKEYIKAQTYREKIRKHS